MNDNDMSIVGLATVPGKRYRAVWTPRLREKMGELKPGQAIRVNVDKQYRVNSIRTAWTKLCKAKNLKDFSRQKMQPDSSYLLWLWYEEKDGSKAR